jgi:hypothetical protein
MDEEWHPIERLPELEKEKRSFFVLKRGDEKRLGRWNTKAPPGWVTWKDGEPESVGTWQPTHWKRVY